MRPNCRYEVAQMKTCDLGPDYIGLAIGACLACLKHQVTSLGVSEEKIALLRQGVLPFHEPSLPELLNLGSNRIDFTTYLTEGLSGANVVFIAVGTPSLPDSNPDLHYVAEELTMMELASLVKEPARSDVSSVHCPLPVDDPKQWGQDVSKARELLNWSPNVSVRGAWCERLKASRWRQYALRTAIPSSHVWISREAAGLVHGKEPEFEGSEVKLQVVTPSVDFAEDSQCSILLTALEMAFITRRPSARPRVAKCGYCLLNRELVSVEPVLQGQPRTRLARLGRLNALRGPLSSIIRCSTGRGRAQSKRCSAQPIRSRFLGVMLGCRPVRCFKS